jgi:hypothetical protein
MTSSARIALKNFVNLNIDAIFHADDEVGPTGATIGGKRRQLVIASCALISNVSRAAMAGVIAKNDLCLT